MILHGLRQSRKGPALRLFFRTAIPLAILLGASIPSVLAAEEVPTNVALFFSAREILFFSAHTGAWMSVRLDAGERVLQRGADGNVAAVLTSFRAIGFSAPLGIVHEVKTEEESVEAFKVSGNVATVLLQRRVLGFSTATGRWAEVQRFYPGR